MPPSDQTKSVSTGKMLVIFFRCLFFLSCLYFSLLNSYNLLFSPTLWKEAVLVDGAERQIGVCGQYKGRYPTYRRSVIDCVRVLESKWVPPCDFQPTGQILVMLEIDLLIVLQKIWWCLIDLAWRWNKPDFPDTTSIREKFWNRTAGLIYCITTEDTIKLVVLDDLLFCFWLKIWYIFFKAKAIFMFTKSRWCVFQF